MMVKDTILVASPSAGGKTFLLNYFRKLANEGNIPYNPVPLSDAQTIAHHMREDDKRGGLNHYHPWTEKKIGHVHHSLELHPEFPFSLYGNVIADAMLGDFFQQLRDLPHNGNLHFAEWAGGGNINSDSEPAHTVDLSFEGVAKKLEQRFFTPDGLDRVLAVIHPYADRDTRLLLNSQRTVPTEEQIKFGTASWQLDPIGMRIFAEDDFHAVVPLLRDRGIAFHTVINAGTHDIEGSARAIIEPVFDTWKKTTIEGQPWNGGTVEKR